MARYIKVSTLGPRPLTVGLGTNPKEIVQLMKNHWTKQLDQVLPDKPDIIVLHEACDRPQGFPMEVRLPYYKERGNQMLDFFRQKAKDNNTYIAYSAEIPPRSLTEPGKWLGLMTNTIQP